jgi:hypothetical protein
MTKGWKTSEFWGALITNLMGIAMLMGYVNAEEGEELGNAVKTLAGAVITVVTTLGYIHERTALKKVSLDTASSAKTPEAPTATVNP